MYTVRNDSRFSSLPACTSWEVLPICTFGHPQYFAPPIHAMNESLLQVWSVPYAQGDGTRKLFCSNDYRRGPHESSYPSNYPSPASNREESIPIGWDLPSPTPVGPISNGTMSQHAPAVRHLSPRSIMNTQARPSHTSGQVSTEYQSGHLPHRRRLS